MRYIVIRDKEGIVGIAELPDSRYARRVFRQPDDTPLTAEEITEAQYTSYKEFDLAPVFSWIPVPNEKDHADIYDPEFFFTDDIGVYYREPNGDSPQKINDPPLFTK